MTASKDELLDRMVRRIYEFCGQHRGEPDFTEDDLFELMASDAGTPITNALISEMLKKRLLRQTRYEPMSYTVTPLFLEFVERSLSPQLPKAERSENAARYGGFRKQLLVALARQDSLNGPDFYDLKLVAENAGLSHARGWIQKAADDFQRNGYVQDSGGVLGLGIDEGLSVQLTGPGLEAAEELIDELELSPIAAGVPASDRIVTLNHNSSEYRRVIEEHQALEVALDKSNEFGSLPEEEKAQTRGELGALKSLLASTRVRVTAVVSLATPVLTYIGTRFADSTISELSKALLKHLRSLLGL